MIYKRTGLIWLFLMQFAYAQTSPQLNAAQIKLALKKLNVVGSVLYVAAHPDDENTRLLSWLAKEKLYRTGYLSLTRGDGGQNLIGSEQSDLLGLIRTQELLAARRTDGAEQFFTRANDFGFSKTPEETLSIWNKDHILADAVWVIRKFRPDIIITRFTPDARSGHGHHQASSIIAQEAFTAAADPKMFPEQLKYVQIWQAKCVLLNGFNQLSNGAEQVQIDIGAYNKILGQGYGEIAAISRSNHKSQGFGSALQRGGAVETFNLWKGTMPKSDLMDGVLTSWKRVAGSEQVQLLVDKLNKEYDIENPDKSVPDLVKMLTAVESLKDDYWREQKSKEIKDLILSCSGLWFECYPQELTNAVNDSIRFSAQIIKRSSVPVSLISFYTGQKPGIASSSLKENELITLKGSLFADKLTQAYYIQKSHPIGEYVVEDQLLIGTPENADLYSVNFTFQIEGKDISYKRPLVYKFTDQVRGEIYQPLVVSPTVTANLENKVLLFADNSPKTIVIKLKGFKNNAAGSIKLDLPAGWKSDPQSIDFSLKNKGDEQSVSFMVSPSSAAASGTLTAKISIDGSVFSQEIKTIRYDHIPDITLFPPAEAKLIKMDLKMAGTKIGYIPGAGDLVPDMLRQIGYQVDILTETQIMKSDLSVYDAIITGVRVYNIDPRIKFEQPQLLKYVENGGNLVIQYNVNRPVLMNQIGPYPFTVGASRVTDENAKITFLKPNHPVLNYPNKITEKDFEGWIQERGLYFATDLDPKYDAILGMNDAGESPSNGSLISTDYGKGRFIYTSLVFFRELPAGVSGAYRLFVNLITKNK